MAGRPDTMLYWLGRVCHDARVSRDRKQAHVAAGIGVDSATVGRFERGTRWPRDLEAMLAAYGDDLDMDARDLWAEAIRRWCDEGEAPQLKR